MNKDTQPPVRWNSLRALVQDIVRAVCRRENNSLDDECTPLHQ
jgi:hypothetical protein